MNSHALGRSFRIVAALALGIVLAGADAAQAGGYYRGWGGYYGPRVGVYFGGPLYWGPSWYWGSPWGGYPYGYGYGYGYGYPYGYGVPYVPYSAPVRYAVPQATYVEPPARSVERESWYYCADPVGYYPHVSMCSRPWVEVAPFATGSNAAPPRR